MDREPGRPARARDQGPGRRKKAAAGLRIEPRGAVLYIMGTVRAAGHSRGIRRSTGLPDTPAGRVDAETIRDRWATEIRGELIHGIKPSRAVALAAVDYLQRPRGRPLNWFDVKVIKEIEARFRGCKLHAIPDADWIRFVDLRQAGNQPRTRERYLNAVCAFLTWCMEPERAWLERLPAFQRLPPKDRQSTTHERRRVTELRPELIALLIESMPWHVIPQAAVMWSTGARVSSIVYGCRLCDVILAEGREQITFHDTKNGDSNTASLHTWAAEKVRQYLERRGRLHDREGPLFLTDRRRPYVDNGKTSGGQNKTAFRAGRRAAIKFTLRLAVRARRAGDLAAYVAHRNDARLLALVTPHWFRHLLATTMLADKTDIRSLMEQAGWRDPRSALRYSHLVKTAQRAAVDRLPIGALPPPAPAKKENGE